jgi:hypothetical protein
VISMGLHPTSQEINELLLSVGADDRLIQLDEFETVRCVPSVLCVPVAPVPSVVVVAS